jgi:hypothetical protein
MNIDRRITLDLSTAGLDSRAAGQQSTRGQTGGQEADAQDRDTFERALAGDSAPKAGAAPPRQERVPAANSFGLLGRAMPLAPPPGEASEAALLGRELESLVSRMAVGDGRSGGALVRMELDESALPGVSVEIEETEGRLQVTFTCGVERSRQRLLAELPERGPGLASQLRREVLLRVQTDDPDDPCLFELLASA